MILNELSVNDNEMTPEQFGYIMSKFLNLCHILSSERGDRDFYYTEDIFCNGAICECTIRRWLSNPLIPQKEKALFRTIINRKQLIDKKQFLESEMLVEIDENNKESGQGCLFAYEMGEYVVSLCTALIWEKEYINGIYVTAEQDDKKVSVKNCSHTRHVMWMEAEERQKISRMVSSGAELWEKKESLYPHLIFCSCVQKQLEEAHNSLHIKMILKRLQILENYFKHFDGIFNKNDVGYRCREESETVVNNSKLYNLRVFETPCGRKEFFTWHISFSGNFPGRIHFIPDKEHKTGIIGYVGKHLPTGKYTTI